MSNSRTLTKDPIAEAQRNWVHNGWEEASGPMAAVTAIMRVQQILLAEAEQVLFRFQRFHPGFEPRSERFLRMTLAGGAA